jgi:dUTP pyrophosphatase
MFIKMYPDVILPEYETLGSAGMDIRAYFGDAEKHRFHAGNIMVIPTGLKVNLLEGFELQVRPRSGLAFKEGITVLNSPGTIDSDYKDEIKICLVNHSGWSTWFKDGDRIAQLVYAPVARMPGAKVKSIQREGGFGSTGIK